MANTKAIVVVSLSILTLGGIGVYLYIQNKNKKDKEAKALADSLNNKPADTTNPADAAKPADTDWRAAMTRFSIGEPVTVKQNLFGVQNYVIYNGNFVPISTKRNIYSGEDWVIAAKAMHSNLPTWVAAPKGTTNSFVFFADRDNQLVHK